MAETINCLSSKSSTYDTNKKQNVAAASECHPRSAKSLLIGADANNKNEMGVKSYSPSPQSVIIQTPASALKPPPLMLTDDGRTSMSAQRDSSYLQKSTSNFDKANSKNAFMKSTESLAKSTPHGFTISNVNPSPLPLPPVLTNSCTSVTIGQMSTRDAAGMSSFNKESAIQKSNNFGKDCKIFLGTSYVRQHQSPQPQTQLQPLPKPAFPPNPIQTQTPQTDYIASNNYSVRRGKWSPEEEAYALAVIREFNSGFLDAPPGTTLRSYLSEKLQCDPMRITKKFTGDSSIGKRVFHPASREEGDLKEILAAQANLNKLYKQWKLRWASQEEESTRKSLAAVAVSSVPNLCNTAGDGVYCASPASSPVLSGLQSSNSVGYGYIPMRGSSSGMRVPPEVVLTSIGMDGRNRIISPQKRMIQNAITRTTTWLKNAESILSKKTMDYAGGSIGPSASCDRGNNTADESDNKNAASCIQNKPLGSLSRYQKEIEKEMEEIARLIEDGPALIATSADLPRFLQSNKKDELSANEELPYRYSAQSISFADLSSSMNRSIMSLSSAQIVVNQSEQETAHLPSMSHHHPQSSAENEEANITHSPTDPMRLLASLSSHAAPVPIVDEEHDGKRKYIPFPRPLPSSVSSSSFYETSMSNERENKRLKLETIHPYSSNAIAAAEMNQVALEEPPSQNADAEDAKTFVDFLQSVVHIKE